MSFDVLEWCGAAASSQVLLPEALVPVCPRFLFVDTVVRVHKGHHLRLLTLRTHGQNRTLTYFSHSAIAFSSAVVDPKRRIGWV